MSNNVGDFAADPGAFRFCPTTIAVDYRTDYEVASHGPEQHEWDRSSQPIGESHRIRQQGRHQYHDIRAHQTEEPDDFDLYTARGYKHKETYRSQNPKIEHKLFTYADAQPVSTYVSKIDHLIRRFGEKDVTGNLVIGILLEADSPGAKWCMSLPVEEKEAISTDYARFKSAIIQRFGRNRNEMMRTGDKVTHSFEKEDTFSVYDYIGDLQ
ncbi:hypothetical protein F4861DRAFT_546962 [Xylaria intraflava]|nr:hypothetical protein F4861DRAFT_546962 [Xylaria intraflava]